MPELIGHYNNSLVAVSVLIAIASAFVALSTVPRIYDMSHTVRRANIWALVFGISLGTGIWSMHFIAMLAFSLPIPIRYDIPLTALSLLVGVCFASLGATFLRQGHELKGMRLLTVGALVGMGIATMHYTGMAAMRLHANTSYNPVLIILSVAIAILASTVALWIANKLRKGEVLGAIGMKVPAAIIMGFAVSSMHYTGMAAMHLHALPAHAAAPLAGLDVPLMSVALIVITVLVQCGVLMLSALDESAMTAKRLLKVEERFGQLLQQSSAAIMTLEGNRFSSCNQATVDMFGCASKEEFLQFSPADLSPARQPDGTDSESAAIAHIDTALTRGSDTFEWTHRRIDGTTFPTNVQLTSIHVGDHSELQAVVTDLSDVKAAEKIRLESEVKFKDLINFLPNGIGLNVGGTLAYANPALTRMLGYERSDDITGTRMLNFVHPDDRDLAVRRKQKINETGRPVEEIEERFLRKNGESFIAAVSSEPVMFGQEKAILVVLRDVSELKHSQERMALLTQAIEQSIEPMMILDAQGVVEYCNRATAEAYDQAPDHIIGRAAAELRGGSVGDHTYNDIIDTVQRGESWVGELSLQIGSDTHIVARRVSPVLDMTGHVAHQIVVDRDITAERKQQEKMEHVQRLESLGVLAGGIAHDFNNILTAIMGHAALARNQSGGMAAEHLDAIENASQRAADLCQQMLAYSGKGKFVVQSINLSELVDEMMRLLEVSIYKSVVMRYELAADLPAIEADLAQLQQIIMNLVINANEAIGERSGNIVISTGLMQIDTDYLNNIYVQEEQLEPGRYVCLEVSDTGCGMSEETQQRIFEPFFTTKFTGRGLGMSAILGIVRGHHGAIKVYSEEGKGTTMKVLFPVVEKDAVSLKPEKQVFHAQGNGTLLIVDDEETIREVASIILKGAGYHTFTAVDGFDAIEQLKLHVNEIDCVLLDMTMPRMGGEEAFTELRRIKPDIKVILSSGYNQQTATQRFTGKGLAGFVQKPYLPDVLLAKISEILA